MSLEENASGAGSTVLAAAANGVVDMIHRYHGDVDAIFGRATLSTRDITSPYTELSLRRYCCLFEEAARQTTNSNFGLRFGNGFEPRRLGAIGYLAVNSPTMAAALRNLVDYFPAHQENSILSLEQDRDVLYLDYQITDPRISLRRQDAELSLGMFCNLFKHCLGKEWAPLEVRFEHPAPDGASEHEERFGAPVLFAERTNSIAFRRRDLDAVMPESDPYLFSIIEPLLAERCAMQENPERFLNAIRERIRLRLGAGELTLARIADDFDMSPAAFQRHLRAHNVSFQYLYRAARRELALRYVRDTQMRFTDVALELGYSEQSAFSRAFRHWTGMSPQRYRHAAQCISKW